MPVPIYRSGWLGVLLLLPPPVYAGEPVQRGTEALAFNCYTCHAPQVRRKDGDIPSLKGKSAEVLLRKLHDFKSGGGNATLMNRIAKGYSGEELARIANFLADDLAKTGPKRR